MKENKHCSNAESKSVYFTLKESSRSTVNCNRVKTYYLKAPGTTKRF